ncbi:MAG: A/G-specific adenine glycosylase [Anaerolineae bacterium]
MAQDDHFIALISEPLIAWYRNNKRDLPWRHTCDPYRIWVSEIMLQQTQVVTVIPYYLRFTAAFPDVMTLAQASLDSVLREWRGLGYYSRARSLHRAAALICQEHKCQVPRNFHELRALPGIGDYTAGAILSIAYGADAVVVDANVRRVLCRLFDYPANPLAPTGKKEIEAYAWSLLPQGQAGDFNQAMMELGAVVCLPKAPCCAFCPLASCCIARQRGVQTERPLPVSRKTLPIRYYAYALAEQGDSVLLVRRTPQGLLGGLWELPGGELTPGESEIDALRRIFTNNLGATCNLADSCAQVKHGYTHFQVRASVFRCRLDSPPLASGQWDAVSWCRTADLQNYGLTGVTVKALAQVGYRLPKR